MNVQLEGIEAAIAAGFDDLATRLEASHFTELLRAAVPIYAAYIRRGEDHTQGRPAVLQRALADAVALVRAVGDHVDNQRAAAAARLEQMTAPAGHG